MGTTVLRNRQELQIALKSLCKLLLVNSTDLRTRKKGKICVFAHVTLRQTLWALDLATVDLVKTAFVPSV